MSYGMTISVVLNVLAFGTAAVYGGMYYESQDQMQRQEKSFAESTKQAKKACDEHATGITTDLSAKIAQRDNALTLLEQSVWAAHDSEVEAIVKAAMFRKDHADVPQPKGERQRVWTGVENFEYVVLFPAEQASLQASDAKFEQALSYLARIGRVSCEQGSSYTRGIQCTGSDAVGKRQVRMAL